MNDTVRFVFVLYTPSDSEKRRAFDIIIDNTRKNIGFGAASNIGIRQALSEGAEWMVVCNQDIRLSKTAVSQLCAIAEQCEPCIFGPEAGSLDKNRWTTILPASGSVDYISGSCMAIHRAVIEKVGMFYELFFMYYEDVDFCVRAKKAGFPLKHILLTGFRHDTKSPPDMKDYYLARNHLLFMLRQAPWGVKLYELLRLPKTFLERL